MLMPMPNQQCHETEAAIRRVRNYDGIIIKQTNKASTLTHKPNGLLY